MTTISNSTLNVGVKTTNGIKNLCRATSEEYAMKMLNRLATLKESDFLRVKSANARDFRIKGTMGKGGYSDSILLQKSKDGDIAELSILRGYERKPRKGEGRVKRELCSVWTLDINDKLPANLREAYDAAKTNFDRIVKF